MNSSSPIVRSKNECLHSWKEIAAYLERDDRTVRRWEKERGLPIRRVPGGGRGAVFAYREEIDAWLSGVGEGKSEDDRDEAVIAANAASRVSKLLRWGRSPGVRVAVVCAMAISAYWLWHGLHRGFVARADFSGNTVVGRDGRGNTLWTYDFDRPLAPHPDDPAQRIAIADLGRDRRRDVLVAAPFDSPDLGSSANDALYCLSAQGQVRWRHEFEDKFRFGGHDYGSPWAAFLAMLTPGGETPTIWAAARASFSSASMLIKLDRDGHPLAKFVNWGHIAVVSHLRNASGSYVLVGGISNQCNCAMLAVLREESASGSSPALEPAFSCEKCPEGKPYRYLLFPRSELTQLSGATYNNLRLIHVEDDRAWVGVSETLSEGSPGPDWIKYDLSDRFVPRSFTVSDHFWTLHRQMEAEGKIHHNVEQCPERAQARNVQMWSAEHGWEQIAVPVSTER
jgi:hypothetical protein